MYIRDPIGTYRPATPDEIIKEAKLALARKVRRGTVLTSPPLVRNYLQFKLVELEHEIFSIIYLDNRNRLIEFVELFRGTIDGTNVHPREVVKQALKLNAAAVILAHNHPSGVAEPSHADELITRRLKEALALVEVRVLDHFIIGIEEVVSMTEKGLM